MSPEEGLQCLSEIISFDPEQNLPLATEVASRYSAQLTPSALVRLFEEAGQPAGLFRYLGFIVNSSDDPEIVFKYIEAAAETGELNELRRICKENDVFEPERVKIFLFERDMDDPRPLIAVCDRFGFIEEMTQHLYAKEMMPFIETYLQKMNPRAAPAVIGALLDLGAPEPAVSVLIDTLRPEAMGEGFAELVEQTANRGFTQLLLPWLERLASEGSEFPALHNALGRAYVEQNLSPEHFIETNSFFDPAELAAFCESRDSRLAFLCFKKARGRCDGDLLRVARENGFYLELAELLVGRQEEPLWISALGEDDEHRKALIAQVVTALSKSREPEEVSVAVKAFIAAELPNELIELLERLVLSGPPERGFKNNKNLQNLLILTAIKADSSRVMSYLGQLSDYDGPDIAKIAVSDQYKLYEEAFQIYERFDCENEAMDVLLEKMGALERAKAFAEKAEKAELWAMLGDAQLAAGSIKAAIESLLKGGVVGQPEKIIAAAAAAENWEELTDYLKMSRGSIKSAVVDSELLFAFCKTGKMDEIRLFLNEPNSAQVDEVGYRFSTFELIT
ncbi:hypothetical protein MHBO_002861 [Bonamia ostreae]|uniref:Clathrin heavy chain n=1 Tax=Bonamia ostreae TaxID=126728 RepID=A0ABV2ANU2_9EUKA